MRGWYWNHKMKRRLWSSLTASSTLFCMCVCMTSHISRVSVCARVCAFDFEIWFLHRRVDSDDCAISVAFWLQSRPIVCAWHVRNPRPLFYIYEYTHARQRDWSIYWWSNQSIWSIILSWYIAPLYMLYIYIFIYAFVQSCLCDNMRSNQNRHEGNTHKQSRSIA